MTKHRAGGKKAQYLGAGFERLIMISCTYYNRFGVADIQKTPEPMKVIEPHDKKNNTFIACFEKQAQPDFKGILKGGQAVLFEAKRTNGKSIAKSRISKEQAINLNSASELGAECFILVSFHERHFYKVPWTVWNNMEEQFKKKSVNQEDLESFAIRFINGYIDFLEYEEVEEYDD